MKYLVFFMVFALITPFLISDAIAVPVERVPITSFGAYSSDGKEIQEIVAGTQASLVSNVTNTLDAKQSFVYGIWISENNGTRTPIDWIETSLDAKSSSVFSISWIPDAAGKYTIEASIWENNETFTAFSAIWQVTLNVIAKDSHELKTPLVPESEPEHEQDSPVYENCGPGTTLQNGICVVDKTKENYSDSSVRWDESAYNHGIKSPLKQIKSGISFENLQCMDGLVLLQKYDSSPACVTESTKQKLIERGWASKGSVCMGAPSTQFDENCVRKKNHPESESSLLTQFEEIKNNIKKTQYGVCDIQLEENKIIIHLNWIFEDSEQEQEIISKVPDDIDYEIIYYDDYVDFSPQTLREPHCDSLEIDDNNFPHVGEFVENEN